MGLTQMKYQIKAFGVVKDIVGGKEITLENSSSVAVGDLLRELKARYPKLTALNSLFVAVNREYAEQSKMLSENDEIALIPPVSGG